MRILIALHQFYPEFSGGTERVALNLAKAAQRAGHHVQVLAAVISPATAGGKPSETFVGALETTWQGVPTTLVPRASLPAAADFSFEADEPLVGRLGTWLTRHRFELVHVLHPMRMGSLILAAQRTGIPYLLTLTDFFSSCYLINRIDLKQRLCPGSDGGRRCASDCLVAPWTADALGRRYQQARDLLGAAGLRVCPSSYVAERYREEFPGMEFKVIPHGIDLAALPPQASPPPPRPGKGITLGFVGTIVPHKGLDILLQALDRVTHPDLRLLVAGEIHGDAVHAERIRRRAHADTRIKMLGRLGAAEVAHLMHQLDVLCLPSQVPETFSLVLHEAAAAGVPALVSALGAPGEHVGRHGCGRCLPANDVEAWADAIAALLERPQTLDDWRVRLPLPLRVEEEAFFYESLYRQIRLEARDMA